MDDALSLIWTSPTTGARLILTSQDGAHARRSQIRAESKTPELNLSPPLYILSVIDEFTYFGPDNTDGLVQHEFHRLKDNAKAKYDLARIIPSCIAFIHDALNVPNAEVIVHCRAGISRSASVVLAYLMEKCGFLTLRDAMTHVESVRPCVEPNHGFWEFLTLLNDYGLPFLNTVAI